MRCLLDTSAVFATVVPRDEHHMSARRFMRQSGLELHTTSTIIGEAYTLMLRRHGYQLSMSWVRAAQASNLYTIHHVSREDDALTWATIERFSGVPLSYADASLIALGRRLGIASVFAFDDDFRGAGLELVP